MTETHNIEPIADTKNKALSKIEPIKFLEDDKLWNENKDKLTKVNFFQKPLEKFNDLTTQVNSNIDIIESRFTELDEKIKTNIEKMINDIVKSKLEEFNEKISKQLDSNIEKFFIDHSVCDDMWILAS